MTGGAEAEYDQTIFGIKRPQMFAPPASSHESDSDRLLSDRDRRLTAF